MTNDLANVLVDVYLLQVNLTLFLNANCILIASTVSEYTLQLMLLRVLVKGSTSSLHNPLYVRCSSRFDIAFHGVKAEINPNMR